MKRAFTDSSRAGMMRSPPLWLYLMITIALALPATAKDLRADAPSLSLLDAAQMTLERDPNIVLAESRRDAARGSLLSARSIFEPQLNSSIDRDQSETPTGENSSSRETTLSSSLGLTALLRSGLSLEPSLTLSRSDGAIATNQATVAFTLRQPLLRNRGKDVVAAGEKSATQESKAREFDLRHEVSRRLLQVISNYWSYRSAAMNLEILRASERSSIELLETTRKLIEADLTPRAEVVLLEADLTSKESNRISGERRLFEARQNLGREIGLAPEEVLDLPLPSDPFPELDASSVPVDEMELWIGQSLLLRADILAARERLIATEISLRAADNALLPQLDFVLTPSYSGLVEGNSAGDFVSPIFENVPGFSTVVGLRFSLPTLNQRAEGDRILAEETRRQRALGLELLEKDVGARVPTSLDAVYRNAQLVEKTILAVALFEKAVENELKKLRAGSSTLIDVISQRDRLTSVQQQEISARLALAQALVTLRFQSGTLLGEEDEVQRLDAARLTSLPFQEKFR